MQMPRAPATSASPSLRALLAAFPENTNSGALCARSGSGWAECSESEALAASAVVVSSPPSSAAATAPLASVGGPGTASGKMCTRPEKPAGAGALALRDASSELSTRSSKASSLLLKLRCHDRHSPFPSTLVNSASASASAFVLAAESAAPERGGDRVAGGFSSHGGTFLSPTSGGAAFATDGISSSPK